MPGMVTVVGGAVMTVPELLITVQVTPARLTLFKTKLLLPGPPLKEFQVAWTFKTVIASCGLVIVMLIIGTPLVILIAPAVI